VCAGAGGHTGRYSPFGFVEEVRRFWSGPLVVAGAISSGRSVRAAEILGADFVYAGTTFISAAESMAAPAYKQMVVECGLGDVVSSAAVTGVMGSWLRPSLERSGYTPEMLEQKGKASFTGASVDVKAWKNLWAAGHGVGSATSIEPAADIVERLLAEYSALARSELEPA